MNAPMLTLSDVNKRFGHTQALSRISLELIAGERLVILGPTGAGKTTLLRTIAGLEQPETGRIFLNNQDITHATPAQRDVAFVFQNFSLYPNKTVRENLAFPLSAPGRNLGAGGIQTLVSETAEMLRIGPLLDRPATHLSGGEMQRVAIGRAIVRQPQLFLFDEPLTNLDAKLRESLRLDLIRLQRELGTLMIYVTHDQIEALSMADRVTVLSNGHIQQTGSAEEVYNRPNAPEIARQLGYPPINLIPVVRVGEVWQTASGQVIMPSKTGDSKVATLGIRPEHIHLAGGKTSAKIDAVEDTGPATILMASWAGERIRVLVSGRSALKPGDDIYPQINTDRAIIWPEAP
jgi:multiple sugar transport system ATP-binding protein